MVYPIVENESLKLKKIVEKLCELCLEINKKKSLDGFSSSSSSSYELNLTYA